MPALDVDALLLELTPQEKASLVLGGDFWHTAAVERLGIAPIMVADGPHGLRMQPAESDHAGIGGSLPATCFPPAAGLASSWDRTLVAEVGHALAHEAREQGVSVVLGPGVNIKRSPLCGRNFEYFSEDPHLAGELALEMVRAVQEGGVGTSLKHFAANNQEDDRLRVSAEVDERTLREIYLPAFERVVTAAQPWTVMCSYNRINGLHASQHPWLLTEVLRDEWGFEGLVVSDWGAVHDRVAALAAGLDLEMPPQHGHSDTAVLAALASGELGEEVLDRGVRRVLELVSRAQPTLDEHGADAVPLTAVDRHHALARRAAAGAAVLLKNDGDLLPLEPQPGSTIALVGAFATDPRYQGAGSSQVAPTRVDTLLEELVALVPEGVEVRHAAGFTLDDQPDTGLLDEAVALARSADTVVLSLGLPAAAESEGFDRTHLDLPPAQLALLEAVAEVHDRVVVLLSNGSVVRLSSWEHLAGAVLECWLGGQASGGGAADLLLGRATPGGKLAETVPLRLEDNPSYLSFPGDSQRVVYGEGVFVGYRGYDHRDQEVSHPFGFGLSYTTFELGRPSVSVTGSVAGGDLAVDVGVEVTNTGARAGAEVVQLYVEDVEASVARPDRELRAFDRVHLEPGESATARLHLDARSFSFWSVLLGRWAVEAGEFVLRVGTSSRDLPHAEALHLDAPSVAPPLGAWSSLHEWLADDRGRALLDEVTSAAPGGGGILTDEQMVAVIGSMPLVTLAGFGQGGLDHATLETLLERL